MFRCVMMPLVGMNNFTLLAIATPGDEFNHYSQLMNLMDDNNKPLFKTIRIALTCPACVKKNVDDVCEHRADLIPAWKSRNRMSRIKKVLEADRELNARENLGLIMSRTEYFIDSAWIRRLNGQPRWLPRSSPPLIFTAVDPSGGGARSSYAIVSVMLQHGQCVVLGVDQIATFKREDINAMLVRHLRHFRKDPMFARAAIVLAIEANYSYVESRDVANLLSVPELQPVVTLCEDNQNLGRPGVRTTEFEKVVYIDTLTSFLRPGNFKWVADEHFSSSDGLKMRDMLCKQMINYRRERRNPREGEWNDTTKVRIFGKADGLQDDLMMALQIAVYWMTIKYADAEFMANCARAGWC